MKKILKISVVIFAVCLIGWIIFALIVKPSNNRNWVTENKILPHYDMKDGLMTIHNVRNYSYRSPLDFDPAYYDKTYDLSKLTSVDFIVAPFHPPSAHTFLSFGFSDGSHVAISIEARRENGEFYDIYKGLVRQYEIMYVVADESDVIKLRTNYREEGDVFLYPIDTTPEKVKLLFLDMMQSVNNLYEKPEFYNTLTNNCTSRIVQHVNKIASPDRRIGFSYKYILPAYAGELAYEMGLIKDTGAFSEVQKKYSIKMKARSCADNEDFSECIRK